MWPRWRWLQPFPPGRKHEIGHAGRGSVGEAGDQPDGAKGRGWTRGGWPVKRKISRAAWTSPAGREAVGRSSRRSAGPRTSSAKRQRSADLARDQPDGAQGLGWTRGGWPVKREISRAGRKAVGRSSRRSAGPRARARPSRRAQPIWQEISRVRVGRAAWAAVGEAAPRAGLRGETPPEVTRAGQRKRPLHA